MKILITGGAGFIGSHIVDSYLKQGHKVVVVDNLSSGFRKNLNKKAKFYKTDIRNLSAFEKIFKKERPQIINHHAAISEVVKSLRDPTLTYETNILGTANVLLIGGKIGIKKFIFISTGGAIYGDQKRPFAAEKFLPSPISPYALSKLVGEKFVEFYAKVYGFDYLIFRYANVFGPRQNPEGEAGVIAIFTALMKEGIRPTIFGDGAKTRDYIFIEDIVKANILGLKKGKNEILNLGCGYEIKDQEVFNVLSRELDFNQSPIYADFREGEVYRIALNSSRAKIILNWKSRTSFKEGIRKYLNSLE